MTQPNWQPLVNAVAVPAKPEGLWVLAYPYVSGPKKLKITAAGTWKIDANTTCTPDGSRIQSANSSGSLLLPAALIGTLLAKIGGSAGDNTAAPPGGLGAPASAVTPVVFAAGSFCIVELTSTQKGSLFLTMNDTPAGFDQHDLQLTVDIFEAL